MKSALVCGGHGFIGHHMARRLKKECYWVRTVDIKEYPYGDLKSDVDDYIVGDLRDINVCERVIRPPEDVGKAFNEVYQFSAWMGGAQVVFSGENDAQIMHDSALLNINIAEVCSKVKPGKIFFSSSACVYNQLNQEITDNPITEESSAYPAYPDSPYGWEKIFAEILWESFTRNHGLDVKIARFHNVYGMEGAWGNGREKSPAAMCRRVAEVDNGGTIEMFGDGEQTRSFLYIDECLEAVRRLMASDFSGPVNIGSDEMVSINKLVEMVKGIANKPDIKIKHIEGPLGVRGRNSDNCLIKEKLGWAPDYPLIDGLKKTYPWIEEQVKSGKEDCPWSN
jgi:nucleoside-diphosphate-sugar epimerase